MSWHPSSSALVGMSLSEYQLRFTTWAYVPAGEACCTLVVVTTPTDFPVGGRGQHESLRSLILPLPMKLAPSPPAFLARFITEVTSLPLVVLHWFKRAAALTPMVW